MKKLLVLFLTLLLFAAPVLSESPDAPELFPLVEGDVFVVNMNTGKFHRSDCRFIKTMLDGNRFDSGNTYDELVGLGYVPCKVCLNLPYEGIDTALSSGSG